MYLRLDGGMTQCSLFSSLFYLYDITFLNVYRTILIFLIFRCFNVRTDMEYLFKKIKSLFYLLLNVFVLLHIWDQFESDTTDSFNFKFFALRITSSVTFTH